MMTMTISEFEAGIIVWIGITYFTIVCAFGTFVIHKINKGIKERWKKYDSTRENCIFNRTDFAIKQEISRLIIKAGGDINIVAAINSWKDTISNEDVLKMLASEESLYPFNP